MFESTEKLIVQPRALQALSQRIRGQFCLTVEMQHGQDDHDDGQDEDEYNNGQADFNANG